MYGILNCTVRIPTSFLARMALQHVYLAEYAKDKNLIIAKHHAPYKADTMDTIGMPLI